MSQEKTDAQCPFNHTAGGGPSNRDWWPNELRLDILHQHSSLSNPMGERFLFGYEWELTKSPAGAHQWRPKGGAGAGTTPDAHDPSKRHAPTMLTTDLSLRLGPVYERISRRFYENPDQFADASAASTSWSTTRAPRPSGRSSTCRTTPSSTPSTESCWATSDVRRRSSRTCGGAAAA